MYWQVSKRSLGNQTAFLDLLFNCVLGFVFLFVTSFLLISPKAEQSGVVLKAEHIVTLTWDDESNDDIDLWMEDPAGKLVFFKSKESGLMHLDRDDVGHRKDFVVLPSGQLIEVECNQEVLTIRGAISGEWTLNIHMFAKRDTTPTRAIVKMEKIDPRVQTIFRKEFTMSEEWQEITVARFTMSYGGQIMSIDDAPKKLVKWNTASDYRRGE
jgi:hypothetical protein